MPSYYDTIAAREPVDAATFNLRMGQIDSVIHEYLHGKPIAQANISGFSDTLDVNGVMSVGVLFGTDARKLAFFTVDTFSGAASDNLDTILFTPADTPTDFSMQVILTNFNAARSVVVRHNVGNIYLSGGQNVTLSDTKKTLQLFWNPTIAKWTDTGQESITDNPGYVVPWTTVAVQAPIDVSGIDQSYKHLCIIGNLVRPPLASTSLYTKFNNDSGANYSWQLATFNAPGGLSGGFASGATGMRIHWRSNHVTDIYRTSIKIIVFNYTSSIVKVVRMMGFNYENVAPVYELEKNIGFWLKSPAAPITRIQIGDQNISDVGVGSTYAILGLK